MLKLTKRAKTIYRHYNTCTRVSVRPEGKHARLREVLQAGTLQVRKRDCQTGRLCAHQSYWLRLSPFFVIRFRFGAPTQYCRKPNSLTTLFLEAAHTAPNTQFQIDGGGTVRGVTKLITPFWPKTKIMVVEFTQTWVDSLYLGFVMFLMKQVKKILIMQKRADIYQSSGRKVSFCFKQDLGDLGLKAIRLSSWYFGPLFSTPRDPFKPIWTY